MALREKYWTKAEAARELQVSERTLGRWYRERIGPPRTKVGAKVWYRKDAVAAWVASRETTPVREQMAQGGDHA